MKNASEVVCDILIEAGIDHVFGMPGGPACVLTRFLVPGAEIDLEKANPRVFPTQGYLKTSPPCISEDDAATAADLLTERR